MMRFIFLSYDAFDLMMRFYFLSYDAFIWWNVLLDDAFILIKY